MLEGRGGWGIGMKSGAKNFSISSRERSSRPSSEASLKQSAPKTKRSFLQAKRSSYWIENITICKEKHPYLDIGCPDTRLNQRVMPVDSRCGLPVFEYIINDEKRRHFHSSYDPESEAAKWARESSFDSDSIVVVLGVGFFYHISELIKRIPYDRVVILMERDMEIFRAALNTIDLKDILSRDNLYLFVGRKQAGAVKFITGIQIDNSFKEISFLPHQPSVQTFPDFYKGILNSFAASGRLNIFDRLRYKKFCHEKLRVLLLTTQYFLMGEIINAMERLGIKYRLATIPENELGCLDFIEKIIKDIIDFKPDFLFTINHLGMDREGVLTQFLTRIEMPFASWYVDNPNLIIKYYEKNITPYCAMFLWDKNNLSDMQDLGFEHTFYMPLGVDEKRFCPIKNKANLMPYLASDVAFVGNSMVKKVRDTLIKTAVNGGLKSLFKHIAQEYAESKERHIEKIIRSKYPELYDDFLKLTNVDMTNYETAVSWEATKLYRLEGVKRLLPFRPLIVGDPYWPELIDSSLFRYHKELAYYDELPCLYNVITINFNATSKQMKGAVNQRVFDIPACNAFHKACWSFSVFNEGLTSASFPNLSLSFSVKNK